MKKRYIYNVAYFYPNGNGTAQIVRKTKINNLAEFYELKSFIEERNGFKNVSIINFQLIGKTRFSNSEVSANGKTKS